MLQLHFKPAVRRRNHKLAFDKVFDDFFKNDFYKPVHSSNSPAVNIIETDLEFRLELAAPGLEKADFEVKVDQDLLSISVNKTVEKADNEKIRRKGFEFSSFKRQFHLPDTIDASLIEANYKNGVLVVSIPKKEEAKPIPPKTIEIG